MRHGNGGRKIERTGSRIRSVSRILAMRIEKDSRLVDIEQGDAVHQVFVHYNGSDKRNNCHINIGKQIARGQQGAVYEALVRYNGPDGLEKQLPCVAKRIFNNNNDDDDNHNQIPAEFIIHQSVTRGTTSSKESGVLSSLGIHCDSEGNYFDIMLLGDKDLKAYLPSIAQLRVNNPELFQHVLMDIIESIGRELHVFSQLELVHGDLKLENIIFCNGWRVIDLGVTESYAVFSASQGFRGSLFYTAPEYFAGDRARPSAVDIYSFGVVLRKLLGMPALFPGFHETELFPFMEAKKAAYMKAAKLEAKIQAESAIDTETSVNFAQDELRARISEFDDVIDCIEFMCDAMCYPFPACRPDLDTLKFAFAHLQDLLKTVPVATNAVSDFYIELLHPSLSDVDQSDADSSDGDQWPQMMQVQSGLGESPVGISPTTPPQKVWPQQSSTALAAACDAPSDGRAQGSVDGWSSSGQSPSGFRSSFFASQLANNVMPGSLGSCQLFMEQVAHLTP